LSKKYHIVYLTINKSNGKCYIGSHSTNNINDKYIGSGVAIKEAISKYSKNNFIRLTLKKYDSYIDSRNDEKYYINLFDTLVPTGYNISPLGGTGNGVESHSKESIEKIRKYNKGIKRSEETKNKIKQLKLNMSEETKQKIGESSRNRSTESNYRCGSSNRGKNTWMKGKKHSEESKEKNRQNHLGKKLSEKTKKKISISTKGENNPMYGKSIYDVWIEKYGKETADIKYINWKNNLKNKSKK